MTANDVAKLSFKILAVYFVTTIFSQAENIVNYVFYHSEMETYVRANYVAKIIPSLLISLFGIILWCAASRLANSVFKRKTEEEKMEVSLEGFQYVAFSIAGWFLLAGSLYPIINFIVYHVAFSFEAPGRDSDLLTSIIVCALNISIGIWLILGSKGIVNGIRALRRPRIDV